jgi:N-acetylglutamate synthase-like GNAT family acetyltransferase
LLLLQAHLAKFPVRQATREDLPEIRSLIQAVRINPTGLDWRRFRVVVAPQRTLLACGQIKAHADGSRELASIAVQEHTRGQGVARAVIEELLAFEPERPLYLMCQARLKLLYAKFGFHAIGLEEMPPYFRRIYHVERVFNSKAQPGNRLLVMRLG